MIVSASYEPYVQVVADRLGVTGVVATRLEVDADGSVHRAAGRAPTAGPPRRCADSSRWLADQGLARSDIELWAYGDSAGDRELLACADHPVWVAGPLDSVAPTSA